MRDLPAMLFIVSGAVIVLSVISVRLARRLGMKKALFDVPNERSSPRLPVPRLGGGAFIPIILLVAGMCVPATSVSIGLATVFLLGGLVLFAVRPCFQNSK